ncbi:unnamed protein product, partial [marine sediment metagenome]
MTLESNALVTLARQKIYLKEEETTHDTILEMLINGVSSFFDLFAERTTLREQVYTNLLLDGNGKNRLYVPDFPINAISALTESDVALTEDTDFYVYSRHNQGYLKRNEGLWLVGQKNIDLSYSAGFKIAEMIYFDTGVTEPAVGDTLQNATSSAEGVITKIVITAGKWDGTIKASGWIEFASITGTFEDNEDLNIKDDATVIMKVNEPDTIIRIPRDLELACMQQVAVEWT